MEAKFILSKSELLRQLGKLEEGLKISYSYKTNKEVGDLLQEISKVDFSIHAKEELEMIKDKARIWFFTQAESENDFKEIFDLGIRKFVVDNEADLARLLRVIKDKHKINLSLRMKFQEHRIGTGKYFVYGMESKRINKLISEIKNNKDIGKLGIHIHRKSQNVNEWEILEELKDSLDKETLARIDFVNLGGGLPIQYKAYRNVEEYIFKKLLEAKNWLEEKNIETWIEPGRFLAGPCVKLEAEIIQVYDNNIVINVSIYNCALDTALTGTKMLIDGELDENEEGKDWLVKGNSPTRDDIFRYRVKLNKVKVGDKIIFLNAGAYNYATDFFGYKKIRTEIVK